MFDAIREGSQWGVGLLLGLIALWAAFRRWDETRIDRRLALMKSSEREIEDRAVLYQLKEIVLRLEAVIQEVQKSNEVTASEVDWIYQRMLNENIHSSKPRE